MPDLIPYTHPQLAGGFPLYRDFTRPLTAALEVHPTAEGNAWAYPKSADTAYAGYRGAAVEAEAGLVTFYTAVDRLDARGHLNAADGFFAVTDSFQIDCAQKHIQVSTSATSVNSRTPAEAPTWLQIAAKRRLASADPSSPTPELSSFARKVVLPLAQHEGWKCENVKAARNIGR